jgi:hypothetical protein
LATGTRLNRSGQVVWRRRDEKMRGGEKVSRPAGRAEEQEYHGMNWLLSI